MYFITSFKQYSSLERQKRNKKNTCNTSFSLKRMGWQKKLDLITYSSLGFTKSDRVNVKDFTTCGLRFTKKMDGCLLEIVLAWLGKSRLK